MWASREPFPQPSRSGFRNAGQRGKVHKSFLLCTRSKSKWTFANPTYPTSHRLASCRERGYSCNRLRGGESVGATLRVRNTVDRGLRLSSVINIKYSVLLLLSARASALPSRRALLAGGGAERVAQVCFGSGCTECQHALRPRPRLRLRGPRAGGHLRPQLHAEVGGA